MNTTWYEDAMQSREVALIARFGPYSPEDKVFKPQNQALETAIPGFAFLRFPPSEGRPFWLYITHGLSQPSEPEESEKRDQERLSGFGIEFALATRVEEAWPFTMLEALTSYALQGIKPVLPWDRVPSSDLMENAPGGHLLALQAPGYDTQIITATGKFHIVHLVGVTSAEVTKAKLRPGVEGSKALECVLHRLNVGCVTDRKRECLTDSMEFEAAWVACNEQPALINDEKKKPFWKIW
ncbi:MAG: suppressor of fused domain protein [Burkholderiales bacterium]|nr:suppressor of fused domain protein [Burkholderiales bacterium]